jgi:hypothetical protein
MIKEEDIVKDRFVVNITILDTNTIITRSKTKGAINI